MKTRKRIAVVMCATEEIYQQAVLKGIFSRCAQYDYDVAVIAPTVQMLHYYDIYLNGEINIFSLMNLELFDGVILVSLPLGRGKDGSVLENLVKTFKDADYRNVVSLDYEIEGYPSVFVDDKSAFREIAEHIHGFHGCKDVYFLSGPEGGDSSDRLEAYLEYLADNGIPCDRSRIFYGDFWYTSGQNLADDIHSGKVHKPEAVICASDHMAIGLVNRLSEYGIKVPDEIIVTGFDSTAEGALNDISITSYNPKVFENAVRAVDVIHRTAEPDIPVPDVILNSAHSLVFGDSCDCINTDSYFRKTFKQNLFMLNHNFNNELEDMHYDIGALTESYILEKLVRAQDEKQCLVDVIAAGYLLTPMETFTLCLRPDWLTTTEPFTSGYPERMLLAGRKCVQDESVSKYGVFDRDAECFDTSVMLPEMLEAHDEPRVYYFMPVHFDDFNFGYCVLAKKLGESGVINCVPKQWLRYVNTALEITKIRTRIFNDTITDVTTGLLNRHGMYTAVTDYLSALESENEYLSGEGRPLRKSRLLVIMIDMDGLKKINDTYGHKEGDYGINTIAGALKSVKYSDDLAVRNGGDEFLFISMGEFTEEELSQRAEEKINNIHRYITEKSASSGKPYPISASFGYATAEFTGQGVLDELISIADERMYENKKKKKAERRD